MYHYAHLQCVEADLSSAALFTLGRYCTCASSLRRLALLAAAAARVHTGVYTTALHSTPLTYTLHSMVHTTLDYCTHSHTLNSMPGRVAKQCRERYLNHLDDSLRRGPWSPEEEEELVTLCQRYKGQWAEVCRLLPGRAYNDIKNHYNLIQRRTRRQERNRGSGSSSSRSAPPVVSRCSSSSSVEAVVGTGVTVPVVTAAAAAAAVAAATAGTGAVAAVIGGGNVSSGYNSSSSSRLSPTTYGSEGDEGKAQG
jgi:Myb-like DNA-binding domain